MSSIVSNIDTRTVAIDERHLACLCTYAARTNLRRIARATARSAVLWVSAQIDANAVAKLLSVRANRRALAVFTGRTGWTNLSTLAAVERITLEVDAPALALRKRERTATRHAIAHRTYRPG
jgi:hypothetical protein